MRFCERDIFQCCAGSPLVIFLLRAAGERVLYFPGAVGAFAIQSIRLPSPRHFYFDHRSNGEWPTSVQPPGRAGPAPRQPSPTLGGKGCSEEKIDPKVFDYWSVHYHKADTQKRPEVEETQRR